MVTKYGRKDKEEYKLIQFDSIQELVRYNRAGTIQSDFEEERDQVSNRSDSSFSGTSSYDQAEDLLLHGWNYMAKELKSIVGANTSVTGHIQKSIYDVVGYTPCVPRYLQGMPDSMVRSIQIPKKEKVITISKDSAYSYNISQEMIKQESAKVLNLINTLERRGYRVNLYVTIASNKYEEYTHVTQVCVKKASQRLNIKQVAFPLVHPSMLRRIWLRTIEVDPWCNGKGFKYGYGAPVEGHGYLEKGTISIPNIVTEPEITDIEKYRV